jgi:hypothetical protein
MPIVKINTTTNQGSETNVNWVENGEEASSLVLNRPIKDLSVVVNTVIDTVNLLAPLDTLDELRNFEPTVNFQKASIEGHTLTGSGSGEFYFDASDTTSTDNNGTIIVTLGGKRWKRSNTFVLTPEHFGFLPTNSLTDNTTAFQNYSNTRSVIYLLDNTTYLIDTLILHSNLIIQGNPTSKIKCKNTVNPTSLANITVRDTNFEYGEDTPNGLQILQFNLCTNVIVQKCNFEGLGYSGDTPLTTGANSGLKFENCTDVWALQNIVNGLKNNWGIAAQDCTNLTIKSNKVSRTGRAGIMLLSGNKGVKVLYNELYLTKTNHINVNANDGCIDLYGPNNDNVLIQGNRIVDGGGSGDYFSGDPTKATAIRVSGSSNVEVCNNTVVTGSNLAFVFVSQSRDDDDSHSVNFHHNHTILTGPVDYGFRHTTGTNIKFDHNTSVAETADGLYQTRLIEFRNEVKKASVSGNTFDGFEGGLSTIDGANGIFFHNSGTAYSDLTINDNTLNADAGGISLHLCDMFTVTGNKISYDQSASGIDISATNSNGIVSLNCIKRPVNPNIYIDAGATNVVEGVNILAVGTVP